MGEPVLADEQGQFTVWLPTGVGPEDLLLVTAKKDHAELYETVWAKQGLGIKAISEADVRLNLASTVVTRATLGKLVEVERTAKNARNPANRTLAVVDRARALGQEIELLLAAPQSDGRLA